MLFLLKIIRATIIPIKFEIKSAISKIGTDDRNESFLCLTQMQISSQEASI